MNVKLTPLGARAVLGMPARELASIVVDLRDVLGAASRELLDRRAAAVAWPDRFTALDDVLGRVVPGAGRRRRGSPGMARVGSERRRRPHRRAGGTTRVEPTPSRRALPRGVRRVAQGRGPGAALRPCAAPAAGGCSPEPGRRGGDLRLLRPGPPDPRMAGAGGVPRRRRGVRPSSSRASKTRTRLLHYLGFSLPSRDAVDARHAELIAAGYAGRAAPHDAFWASRYAVRPRRRRPRRRPHEPSGSDAPVVPGG